MGLPSVKLPDLRRADLRREDKRGSEESKGPLPCRVAIGLIFVAS